MNSEDSALLATLSNRSDELRQHIAEGQPYVWLLRITPAEFNTLEERLRNSLQSHGGDYRHLLTQEFALHLVIYLAEWYKRYYCGGEHGEKAPVVQLRESREREQLWDAAGIDSKVFVYNASENPDKPNRRWKESLQVLGGLAVQDELRKDEKDPLLSKLCKIYHGEDIDVSEVSDRERAVAFQQSIVQGHSLYDYVRAILEPAKDGRKHYPFSDEDLKDPSSPFARLVRRIENADRVARKNKFDFEWLISYAAYYKQMVRRLRICLKPEAIGGKYKQYIGYDRLHDFWGIEHPENVKRLMFDLRFVYRHHVVREATFKNPLLTFSNTGKAETGFVAANDIDEIVYTHIPTEPFTAVELWMRYDNETMKVQEALDCSNDYLQVYKVANAERDWSSRVRPQSATSVIFSNRYRLKDESQAENIVRVPFKDGEEQTEPQNWLPIFDVVTLLDEKNHEVSFFNRNGYYQVVVRKYADTIRYEENLYVIYKFTELSEDDVSKDTAGEQDYLEEKLPLLFGREGLEVRHYASMQAAEWKSIENYELEWLNPQTGRYVDWNTQAPCQGKLRLRVTVKGMVLKYRVYYVPFEPNANTPLPIWRDFNNHCIRFAVDGKKDLPDTFNKNNTREADTRQVELGTTEAKVLVDVYRPFLLKELYQNGKLIEYIEGNENVEIPMLICQQFTVRDFNKKGVQEYDCARMKDGTYLFHDFHNANPSDALYRESIPANKLSKYLPDSLSGYLSKYVQQPENMMEWDYKSEPKPLTDNRTTIESGIIFQSLKDNAAPRHYAKPRAIVDEDGWDFDDEGDADRMSNYEVYRQVARHKVYFFLFEPMRTMIFEGRQIADVALPLMKERQGRLTQEDLDNLYRMAYEFHFDWMLLARDKWHDAIAHAAESEEEAVALRKAVTEFFMATPKAADERERKELGEMMKCYWEFNDYSTNDTLAQKALRYILGDVDGVLRRNEKWEDFLTAYDQCRYKFAEMSRLQVTENKT